MLDIYVLGVGGATSQKEITNFVLCFYSFSQHHHTMLLLVFQCALNILSFPSLGYCKPGITCLHIFRQDKRHIM